MAGVDGDTLDETMAVPGYITPDDTGRIGQQADIMTAEPLNTRSTGNHKMSATTERSTLPGMDEHILASQNDARIDRSHSYEDTSYVKVQLGYKRSSSTTSQSSQSSAGTGGQSGASSIHSVETGGQSGSSSVQSNDDRRQSASSSVQSLEHIHSVSLSMLGALMDKFQTVEDKEVRTAQDQLNNAQQRLTTYGKNEENLKRARPDLKMAKSNAELGYNGAEDILIKVHATRIICSSTMYLNYPASLEAGRDECIRRLSKLYKLSKVQEAFEKFTQDSHTTVPGLLARLWSYPDPERSSQQDIVKEVCRLDELMYRFLYAGGLISERIHWPQVGTKFAMLLAYDRALVDDTVPLFTSVSLPGVKKGSGFVDITTTSSTATLVTKNAQHVAVADIAEDEKVEFVYKSVEQDSLEAASDFPSASCLGVDSSGKVHFTTEGQEGRVWIFTSDHPQQGQKLTAYQHNEHTLSGSLPSQKQNQMLSGTLQCICGRDKPSIPRQIKVQLDDVNDGGMKRVPELQVVSIAAANGIVHILVSTKHQAWVVRVKKDQTSTTALDVHRDLLPLQKSQCQLVPWKLKLRVLHFNLRWNCDEEHLLCPGLYEFDTVTGDVVRSDTSPIYTTSHSGRLATVSGLTQHPQTCHGHPQDEPQKCQKLPQSDTEQHLELFSKEHTESEQHQKLSGCLQIDTKQDLLLIEVCPNDPYSDTKALRVLEGNTWKELASWKSTSQSKSLDACVAPDGNVIAVLDDASLFIYDLQTGRELGVETGLRDSNMSPCRICWYGERFVLLTFKNTPEVHKIAVRL